MNTRRILHLVIVMSLFALSACSKRVKVDDYNVEEMNKMLIGKWISYPTDYECNRYNLDPKSEIVLDIRENGIVIIKNLPVVSFERAKEVITIVDDSGSWRLDDSVPGHRWEVRLYPDNLNIGFGIDIKKKFNTIYLDYIIDPEYPSGFVFNKVESNP